MNGSWNALRIVTEALRPGAGGPGAAVRRRRQTDWATPLALANAHFVTPSLYANLRRAGALGDLPDDVRDYLALLYQSNKDRNAALRRQALELVGALCESGVQPLLLKGALTLFLDHYADRAARMIGDLDVLVPARAASTVFRVLRDLGYGVGTFHPVGHHAYADFTRPNDPAAIDLHFELVDTKYVLPAEEVWDRANTVRVGDLEFFVPSPADFVLHNLLHAQIHYLGNYYRGVVELRQLYEFAAFARRYGESIDWEFIARRMARHRLDTPLYSYALAARRLFEQPWPLPAPPGVKATLHYGRCIAQFHLQPLAWLGIPWGNLRAAFAWHRMNALYDSDRPSPLPPVRHALNYLRKKNASAIVGRLFRVR